MRAQAILKKIFPRALMPAICCTLALGTPVWAETAGAAATAAQTAVAATAAAETTAAAAAAGTAVAQTGTAAITTEALAAGTAVAPSAAAAAAAAAPAVETVDTSVGTFELPVAAELQKASNELKEAQDLSEQEKKLRSEALTEAFSLLDRRTRQEEEFKTLQESHATAKSRIDSLAREYEEAEKNYRTLPDISALTEEELQVRLDELKAEASRIQTEQNAASVEYNTLQTLPTKAQKTISSNNTVIKQLGTELAEAKNPEDIYTKIKALKLKVLNRENEYLQAQLTAQTELMDINNYRVNIAGVKNAYYASYIKALQDRQNEMLSAGLEEERLKNAAVEEELRKIPELKKLLDANDTLNTHINNEKQKTLQLSQDFHDVESAVSSLSQIEQTLDSQVKSLDRSLVLSRLLNRQQSEIPQIKLSYNLDETIPDLNIWLYELRERRQELFDLPKYVDGQIGKQPKLEAYRNELSQIAEKRRNLFDQLYQLMSQELSQSISLKLIYQDYQDLDSRVRSNIVETMFWLRSNQPLGLEFLKTLMPSLAYEAGNLKIRLHSSEYFQNVKMTVITLILPAMLVGFMVYLITPSLRRRNQRLAGKLDRRDDSFWVTPLAILNMLIMVIPKAVWRILIGAIFVCLALDTTAQQQSVVLMLVLHVFVFVFFLEILSPNALAQRHFSVNPAVLRQNRLLLSRVWLGVIPIVIVANISEISSANIFYDITGYVIVMCCSLLLVVISVNWIRKKLRHPESMAPVVWLVSACCLLIPVCLVVMLGTGYYYTAVKLINRFAYTCYLGLLYWIVSNTIRRSMYVVECKMRYRARSVSQQSKGSGTEGQDTPAAAVTGLINIDSLRFELISSRAFKLIRTLLLVVTVFLMYMQWNDLAGVLGYLNTIRLWSETTLINGKEVITEALTLANVLLACLILVVAVVLNRNLPSLLERMVVMRGGTSTGYTVRIVSSYAITALGLVLAAGALGIKWENLQWLVAALSVGLGFGLQEIFANFVSGLIILFERQIRVGDIITLDTIEGTVSKIRIRSTTVVAFDNKEVLIPNKQFITSALVNWSLSSGITKLTFDMGISYDSDAELAKRLMRDIVNRCPYLCKSKAPMIYIAGLQDSVINVRAEVYVAEISNRKATEDYLSIETLRVFEENGLNIPFNQLDVNFRMLEKEEFFKKMRQGLYGSDQKKAEVIH